MGQQVFKVVPYAKAEAAIRAIREQVFQVEQGVEPALDFDGLDEAALHIVAYDGAEAIGTARIRYLSDDLVKIERVAVLSRYRGRGVGREIMETAIAFLEQQPVSQIKVNAQVQVKAFYQKLGFEPWGDEFDEAGILHVEMRRIR